MIFVYRRPGSEGATELAEALDGRRVRFYGNGEFRRLAHGRRYPLTREDVVVCWGEVLTPVPPGVRALNNTPILNKMSDALALRAAGVPTVEVSRTRPAPVPAAVDPAIALWEEVQELAQVFSTLEFNRGQVHRDGVRDLMAQIGRLGVALGTPPPAPVLLGEWLGRTNRHVGGEDLLTPPPHPDYFSKKEELVEEYRIHSFLGKSIKAGVKVPREGVAAPHPWIRSLEAGWRIRYDGFESRREMREMAGAAVSALNLDFGAVDLGRKSDRSLIVLEVNRAPGLADGTANSYARAIRGWRDGNLGQQEER